MPEDAERTLTGWEYYPQAVGHALRHTAEIVGAVPLIVTENGIATDDDSRRIDYTTGALMEVAAALEDGVDVRGYLHWSALDNYEWGSYKPTFGLIAVDPHTFERTPKPSAAWLGGLGRSRMLPRVRLVGRYNGQGRRGATGQGRHLTVRQKPEQACCPTLATGGWSQASVSSCGRWT